MLTFIVNSVMFAVAVVAIVLMSKASKANNKYIHWVLVPGLALIGGSCFAATGPGAWIAQKLGSAVGPLLIGAISLILMFVIYLDLRDKKADKTARFGLMILPILFIAGTGPLADLGQTATSGVAEFGAASIGRLIGG